MTSREDQLLADLFRESSRRSIKEAVRRARTSQIVPGTVEAIDPDELTVAWIRMDPVANGGDPTESDNVGWPGVLPMYREGETYNDETVRVVFNGPAGGSAMQTDVPTRRVFPYGAETTQRTVWEGAPGTGFATYYNDDDVQVGYQSPIEWSVGTPGSALARLSPLGGLRFRDLDDILRAILSPYEGVILLDPVSGISGVSIRHDGLTVLDPVTGEELTISTGAQSATPTPKWVSNFEISPLGSHTAPAINGFGTGADITIPFVCASAASELGASSYSPPAGHTERIDASVSGNGLTLAMSAATQAPITNAALTTFTNSLTTWNRANGHTVIVRGQAGTTPSFRSSTTDGFWSDDQAIGFDIAKPAGVVEGDMMIAFVAMAGPAIPVDWTVPDGWEQLGVVPAGVGTSHILASGIWAKLATASEPATEHVEIVMSSGLGTRVRWGVVAIQSPFKFTSGLDIRLGGVSIGRRGAVIPMGADRLDAGLARAVVPPNPVMEGIYRGLTFSAPAGPVVRVKFAAANRHTTTGSVYELRDRYSGAVTGTAVIPIGSGTAIHTVSFEWLHGLNMDTATAADFGLQVRVRAQAGSGTSGYDVYNPVVAEFVDTAQAPNATAAGNPTVTVGSPTPP